MIKIAYYSSSSNNLIVLSNALSRFINEKGKHIDVLAKGKNELNDKDIFNEFLDYVSNSDVLIMCLMGGKESCPGFNKLIKALPKTSKIFIKPCNTAEIEISLKYSNLNKENWEKFYKYLNYSGVENYYNMLIFSNNLLSNSNYPLSEPKDLPWEGIYHPDFLESLTLKQYLNEKYKPDVPTVGIWFHRAYWINNDTDYIDNIIKEIEENGANAIAVFRGSRKNVETGSLSAGESIEKFFVKDKKILIDVLINTMMFSTTMMDKEN